MTLGAGVQGTGLQCLCLHAALDLTDPSSVNHDQGTKTGAGWSFPFPLSVSSPSPAIPIWLRVCICERFSQAYTDTSIRSVIGLVNVMGLFLGTYK